MGKADSMKNKKKNDRSKRIEEEERMNVGISSPTPATEDDNHHHHLRSGAIKPTCVTTTSPSKQTAAAVNFTTSDHPSSHNITSHGSGSSSHSVVAHAASFARSSSRLLENDPNNNIHNSKDTNRQYDYSHQNDCSSNSSDCTPNSKSNRHSTTSNRHSHNNDDSSGSDPCSSLTRSASFPTISKNEGSHSSAEGHCFSSISTTRTTSPGTRCSGNNINSQDRVVSKSDPTSPLPLLSSSPQQQSPKSHDDKGEKPTSESSNAVRSSANVDDDDSKRPQSIVSAPAKTTGSLVKHHVQEQLPLVATTKRNHKTSATKTTSTSQTCAGEAATAVIAAAAAATSTNSKSAPNSVRSRYLASSKTLFLSSRDRLFARKSASTLAGGAGSKQGSNDKHNKNNNATGGASVSGSSIGTTSTGSLSTKPPLPLHHTHSCTSTLSTKSFYQLVGSNSVWSGRKIGPGRAHNNTPDDEYSKVSRTSSSSSSFFDRFGWYGTVTGIGGFWLACVTFVGLFTLITVVVAQVTAAASNPSSSSFASSLSSSSSTSISFTSYSSSSLPFRFYMSSSGENNKDAGAAPPLKVVVATRLHNRQSTHALTDDAVRHKIRDFAHVCEMADAIEGVIAVDAEDPQLLHQVQQEIELSSTPMHLLPITPWGRFVPALNALIGYAAGQEQNMADCILFVSAETSATRESIQMLLHHMMDHSHDDEAESARLRSSKLSSIARTPKLDNSTLVVGARLTGHDYRSSRADQRQEEEQVQQQPDGNTVADNAQVGATIPRVVELNGRTTPWNTLAVWNLRKLATTGFLLLSEGYLTSSDKEPSYGVEEVVTIALLQQLLGKENAVAKLVPVPGVDWDANFGADVDRQQWHESKMESKLTRAARQMELTKLSGVVHHY
ncbi:hypothetical protein ACA910_017651 [Epithemia clementina (nom. ined.)]